MSKVAIEGNASGTGTLTIAAPNTNTNRTITLPDATGTLALTSAVADKIEEGDSKVEVTDAGTGKVEITVDAVEVADFTTGAIVFNETGANQDFRVEGDTNANLLVVDASADRVGVGIDAPSAIFHTQQTSAGNRVTGLLLQNVGATANTAVSLDFSPQESSTNANTLVRITALRTALVNGPTDIVFSNYNDGLSPSGLNERMRINSNGDLILVGSTAQKASGTTWSNPSDQRLKNNIRDYGNGLAELVQVRVREWEYNGKGGTTEGSKGIGVVADEVMSVLPNTVDTYKAILNENDQETTDIKRFDATEITWLLVKAVQELKAELDQAKTRIAALENNNA